MIEIQGTQPAFSVAYCCLEKEGPLGTLRRTRGMGQFGRSATLPAQSGQDHMEALPKPKSSGTSMEEDSSKKPDADVVVDKLSGLALKQQKISENHRRKLMKQRQKLRVEWRTVTTEPLTMPEPGHRSSMHFFTEVGCDGGWGGISSIKCHNKFARFRHILAKDPKAARSIGR